MDLYDYFRFNQYFNLSLGLSKLHVDSIRKSFGERVILSDIYLSCKKGEIVGLLGRNGSGKSVLLKIIFGIEPAENKFVRANKKVVNSVSDARNLINYLPQSNFLPSQLKIRHIVRLFLPFKKAEEVLSLDALQSLLDKRFGILSGGEKRIIEILLMLHSEAEFILLDEPFNGVSPIVIESLMTNIKKEKNKKGFVITDHDYENVLQIADKILYLENGVLKEISDKEQLLQLGYLNANHFNSDIKS